MYINSTSIIDTRESIKIYNLQPYIINTVNVYFITSDQELYKDILTPASDGNPRVYISVDGCRFPLLFNHPGESPLNPIKYTKSIKDAKFSITEQNTLDNKKVTGFVGSDTKTDWTPNTNINDVNDFIEVRLDVTSIPTQVSTRYGYGLSPTLKTETNPTGKYGYGSTKDQAGNIISYGGYGNDFIFRSSAIIVENSQREVYDYLYSDKVKEASENSINGYGEGPYGGDPSNGFGE